MGNYIVKRFDYLFFAALLFVFSLREFNKSADKYRGLLFSLDAAILCTANFKE